MNDSALKIAKLVNSIAHRHGGWQIFSDFVEAAAISISNAVDLQQREKREQRYMDLIKRYDAKEISVFPQMLAELTMGLESGLSDVMGRAYHELELHNKWAGQYFTPYEICRMMAKMTIGDADHMNGIISERGCITIQEPACGSGAMVIAFADGMRLAGINYQQHLHVTAIDVDAKCVHMAYLQCSLLHIPAVIVHGNTLSLQEYGHWYTPAHIMGGWNLKLRRARSRYDAPTELVTPVPEPTIPIPITPSTAPAMCDKHGQGMLF